MTRQAAFPQAAGRAQGPRNAVALRAPAGQRCIAPGRTIHSKTRTVVTAPPPGHVVRIRMSPPTSSASRGEQLGFVATGARPVPLQKTPLPPGLGAVCTPSNVPSACPTRSTGPTASWKNQNPASLEPFVAKRSAPEEQVLVAQAVDVLHGEAVVELVGVRYRLIWTRLALGVRRAASPVDREVPLERCVAGTAPAARVGGSRHGEPLRIDQERVADRARRGGLADLDRDRASRP
jgi:hypothetical protein